MSDADAPAQEYCSNLVRERDEDRWLAARYADGPLQRKLIALYAFHAELRRIPAMVSEPPLGEIRLQWWREALEEIRTGKSPRAHPVVAEFALAGLAGPVYESFIAEAIDANAHPLYGEPFSNIVGLEDWLSQADGAIDAAAALLAGAERSFAEMARRAGAGFALAREGHVLAQPLSEEIRTRSVKIAQQTADGLRAAPASLAPAVLHLALTKPYSRRSGRPFPITKRLKLFTAMAFGAY